jgi:sporulation protein YlmC with PRC-barrel domain
MQCRITTLIGYLVQASDGQLGSIQDVYFDDRSWAVRYLVIDAGSALAQHKVLLSAEHLGKMDAQERVVHTTLGYDEAMALPVDVVFPNSRQQQENGLSDQAWPFTDVAETPDVGSGTIAPTAPMNPVSLLGTTSTEPFGELFDKLLTEDTDGGHLRSAYEVSCYAVVACDGAVGQVVDFLIDTGKAPWMIHNLLVDTQSWLPGQKILLAPHWIEHVNWEWEQVHINASRQSLLKDLRLPQCVVTDRARLQFRSGNAMASWHPGVETGMAGRAEWMRK